MLPFTAWASPDSLPKFPPFPISVDRSALENSLQEQEADSSRIFSLMREPFLKLQKCTQPGKGSVLADRTHVLPGGEDAGQVGPQPPATAWQGPEVLLQAPGPTHVQNTGKHTALGCLQRRLPQRSPERDGSWGLRPLRHLDNREGLARFTRSTYSPVAPGT